MKTAKGKITARVCMIVIMLWSVLQIRNGVAEGSLITGESICWNIFIYELVFLAAAFGLVRFMGNGQYKRYHSEEQ